MSFEVEGRDARDVQDVVFADDASFETSSFPLLSGTPGHGRSDGYTRVHASYVRCRDLLDNDRTGGGGARIRMDEQLDYAGHLHVPLPRAGGGPRSAAGVFSRLYGTTSPSAGGRIQSVPPAADGHLSQFIWHSVSAKDSSRHPRIRSRLCGDSDSAPTDCLH